MIVEEMTSNVESKTDEVLDNVKPDDVESKRQVVMMCRDNFYHAVCDMVREVALTALHAGFRRGHEKCLGCEHRGYAMCQHQTECFFVRNVRIEYKNIDGYYSDADKMECIIECLTGTISIFVSPETVHITAKGKGEDAEIVTEEVFYCRYEKYADHGFLLTSLRVWLKYIVGSLEGVARDFLDPIKWIRTIMRYSIIYSRECERRINAVVSEDEQASDASEWWQAGSDDYRKVYDDRKFLLPADFAYDKDCDCWADEWHADYNLYDAIKSQNS